MDRFVAMSVFTKVVEGGSFAAAARHFELSPAMVSKHIQILEQQLGVRLLNRTTRRVNTTEAGQEYYERSVHILSEIGEADRAAADLQMTPRGRLKLSTPVTFGTRYVAPAISDYLETYPEVSVDLVLDDRVLDLVAEGFDLAIRLGDLADSSLIARKLGIAHMVMCASPAYLAQNGAPSTLEELAQRECLTYSHATIRSSWRLADSDGHEEIVHVSGRLRANNGDALRVLATEGKGIALLPDFVVNEDLRAGRLAPLMTSYTPADLPIQAIHPHSRFVPAKVRTFIGCLAARFMHPLEIPDNGKRPARVSAQKLGRAA
jgi:DNA-binding transcriptional LysR family regulator